MTIKLNRPLATRLPRSLSAIDGLTGTAVNCPVVDSNLLHKYLSYFVDSGFLKTLQLLNN
jgi:hypothetical protein